MPEVSCGGKQLHDVDSEKVPQLYSTVKARVAETLKAVTAQHGKLQAVNYDQLLPYLPATGRGHSSHFSKMSDTKNQGPQYPAEGDAKISGDPACSVAAQGTAGGLATWSHLKALQHKASWAVWLLVRHSRFTNRFRPHGRLRLHSRLRKLLSLDGKFL